MKISQKFAERMRRPSCLRSGGRECAEDGEAGVGGRVGMKKEGIVATDDKMAM